MRADRAAIVVSTMLKNIEAGEQGFQNVKPQIHTFIRKTFVDAVKH